MELNQTRVRRVITSEKEQEPTLDVPYSASKEASGHSLTQRPLATSKNDSLLSWQNWIVADPILAKEKATSRSASVGPLTRLGGGLDRLTRIECFILLGLTVLATIVRLWRIDRPDSVVFDEVHFGGKFTQVLDMS